MPNGEKPPHSIVTTYSIEACDPQTSDLGGAVQSRFIGIGIVDADGIAAAFTGLECFAFASQRTGKGFSSPGLLELHKNFYADEHSRKPQH